MEIFLIVLLCAVLGSVGVLLFLQTRKPDTSMMAVIQEKLANLEKLAVNVQEIQVELRGVRERIVSVEKDQSKSVGDLGQSMQKIGTDVQRAIHDLIQLETHTKARYEQEQKTAESIKRLENIIAGTQTKGKAGENIVEMMFNNIPLEWQERQFKVANKPIEFAIRLPNNRILPIDSKWTATDLLDQFSAEDNPDRQCVLKEKICDAVMKRVKEVAKYVDPPATMDFAVAVVPDAVYELAQAIRAEVFRLRVVLVSYSLFMPYLLLVFQTVLATSKNISMERLNACLQSVQSNIVDLKNEIEGRFSRAIKELTNSREDMSAILSKASGGLTGLQLGEGDTRIIRDVQSPSNVDTEANSRK